MSPRSIIFSLGRPPVGALFHALTGLRLLMRAAQGPLAVSPRCYRLLAKIMAAQIYYTGWQGVPLVSLLAGATSGLAFLQTANGGVMDIGQTIYLLYVVGFRELATLLTALMVIARSGTAVASELGNMRAHREVASLELLGIDPYTYLVFPRIFAGMVSMVCLALTFLTVSFTGAYAILYTTQGVAFSHYVDLILRPLTFNDLVAFALKAVLDGFAIFMISCQQGLSVRLSPHEVPQVTTRAVVHSILTVVALHIAIDVLQVIFSGGL